MSHLHDQFYYKGVKGRFRKHFNFTHHYSIEEQGSNVPLSDKILCRQKGVCLPAPFPAFGPSPPMLWKATVLHISLLDAILLKTPKPFPAPLCLHPGLGASFVGSSQQLFESTQE